MQTEITLPRKPLYTPDMGGTIRNGLKVVGTKQKTLGHAEYKTNVQGMKTHQLQREHESVIDLTKHTSNGAWIFWNTRAKILNTEMIRRGIKPIN